MSAFPMKNSSDEGPKMNQSRALQLTSCWTASFRISSKVLMESLPLTGSFSLYPIWLSVASRIWRLQKAIGIQSVRLTGTGRLMHTLIQSSGLFAWMEGVGGGGRRSPSCVGGGLVVHDGKDIIRRVLKWVVWRWSSLRHDNPISPVRGSR
jgi:hypothetical protein